MTATAVRAPARAVTGLEQYVGNTPLVSVNLPRLPESAQLLAKLEMYNPTFSVKDRAGVRMIADAERAGRLPVTGGTIVECSSGSMGISLASVSLTRGHRCIIVLPDNATVERRVILERLGAEIVLAPHQDGLLAAWRMAEELADRIPGAWVPHQDRNPSNVAAHYEGTGPEIWRDCQGKVDVFVCGVGTGGTITGVAKFLKERRNVYVVAVEPAASAVLSGREAGPHRIYGIGAGYVSDITDVTLIDEVVPVDETAAVAAANEIARATGLLVGVSSGAAAHVATVLAQQPAWQDATIVTLFPDSGERYLSCSQVLPPAGSPAQAQRGSHE